MAASDQPTVTGPTTSRDNPAVLDAERHERQLEKGIEDSFPASDPPAVTQPAKPPTAPEACDDGLDKAEQERQLEEGLEETFPASDPVSITSPEQSIDADDDIDMPPTDADAGAAKPTVEGTFAEGLFIPAPEKPADGAAQNDAERLDDIGNASMPPGGTYS